MTTRIAQDGDSIRLVGEQYEQDAVPAVRALRLELHTNNISDREDSNA